jgi:hypothetical protein
MAKRHFAAALLIGLFSATTTQAASVSFYLNQSNSLPDDVNYLQVNIADGADGAIDFTVIALQPLLDIAGENFGIEKFAFNVLGGVGTWIDNVTAMPTGWQAGANTLVSGFGTYDLVVDHQGSSGHDPVTFSITGIDLDTVMSYVGLSSGDSPQGPSFFSAYVGGFNFGDCADTTARSKNCYNGAFFGGGTAVPAPAAIWLLGTAVGALVVRRRIRGTAAA